MKYKCENCDEPFKIKNYPKYLKEMFIDNKEIVCPDCAHEYSLMSYEEIWDLNGR